MNLTQILILITLACCSVFAFAKGSYESFIKKNSFGDTPFLFWLGIFVWGDATIFGAFWCVVTILAWWRQSWNLFLLFIAVFWLVRSIGESIYWFNQQFSTLNRNPPANLRGFHFFQNDSIWFIYQIFWQCVTVFSIISTFFIARSFFN